MTDQEILKKATWNKNTTYQEQITFIGPDGYQIHIVRTFPELHSRKHLEEALIEAVREKYGDTL